MLQERFEDTKGAIGSSTSKHFSTIFQVTNRVRETLVTFENQSSIIY